MEIKKLNEKSKESFMIQEKELIKILSFINESGPIYDIEKFQELWFSKEGKHELENKLIQLKKDNIISGLIIYDGNQIGLSNGVKLTPTGLLYIKSLQNSHEYTTDNYNINNFGNIIGSNNNASFGNLNSDKKGGSFFGKRLWPTISGIIIIIAGAYFSNILGINESKGGSFVNNGNYIHNSGVIYNNTGIQNINNIYGDQNIYNNPTKLEEQQLQYINDSKTKIVGFFRYWNNKNYFEAMNNVYKNFAYKFDKNKMQTFRNNMSDLFYITESKVIGSPAMSDSLFISKYEINLKYEYLGILYNDIILISVRLDLENKKNTHIEYITCNSNSQSPLCEFLKS